MEILIVCSVPGNFYSAYGNRIDAALSYAKVSGKVLDLGPNQPCGWIGESPDGKGGGYTEEVETAQRWGIKGFRVKPVYEHKKITERGVAQMVEALRAVKVAFDKNKEAPWIPGALAVPIRDLVDAALAEMEKENENG